MKKKKVVVLGGGNGSAAVLVALKQNLANFDISAVISMSDSGGLQGRLMKKYGFHPPADILRAALALSAYGNYPVLKEIFYSNRFKDVKKMDGLNFSYPFFLWAWKEYGMFTNALRAFEQAVKSVGMSFPNTLDKSTLMAELDNGKILKGEGLIDKPNYDRKYKIKKVWLEQKVRADKNAENVIKDADYIILSPGSLYTSVVAAVLPSGIQSAIKNSKAKIIYACGNAYRTDSETGPEDVAGTVRIMQQYLPRKIDFVLHNNHKLSIKESKKYKEKKWGVFKDNTNELKDYKVISFDYEREGGGLCSVKLGKKLKEVLK